MKQNKRQRQRERWTEAGLLRPSERIYRKGRRGVEYIPHPDTAACEEIIRTHLADGHTLADAAEELILMGHDLAKPVWVRRWLIAYCDRWIKAVSLRSRTPHGTADDAAPSRAHIQRSLRTFGDRADMQPATRDFASIAILGANGILPRSLHGVLLPDDEILDWRRLRDLTVATTDARLMQALADAREVADREGEQLAARFQVLAGISAADVARSLLPGHRCKTRHTVGQAALARGVLAQIDPLSGSPDTRQVGSAFLEVLTSGIAEIGALIGNVGS